MRKGMLIVALALSAPPAFAGSQVSSRSCVYSHFYGYSNCIWTSTYAAPPAYNFEQERIDTIAQAKQDEKWDAFCKPVFRTDDYGIRRASYASKGCDVGRSE